MTFQATHLASVKQTWYWQSKSDIVLIELQSFADCHATNIWARFRQKEPHTAVSSGYCSISSSQTVAAVWMRFVPLFSLQTEAGFVSSRLKLLRIDKIKLFFSPLMCHVFLFSWELIWVVGAPFTVPSTVCNLITFLWDNFPLPAAFQSREDVKKTLLDKLCLDSRKKPSSYFTCFLFPHAEFLEASTV